MNTDVARKPRPSLRQIAMWNAAIEDVAVDAHALIHQVARARLLAEGHTQETAQVVVERVLGQPSPYTIPTIAELGNRMEGTEATSDADPQDGPVGACACRA